MKIYAYTYDMEAKQGNWTKGHFQSMIDWCVSNHVSFTVTKYGSLRCMEIRV